LAILKFTQLDFRTLNLRVISSQGGYRLEVDAFPIDGPYEISSDELSQIANEPAKFFSGINFRNCTLLPHLWQLIRSLGLWPGLLLGIFWLLYRLL
jgi:hypothetical protein